jgi:hypothetical protein
MPFQVHHLALVKLVLEKVVKYLVLPGLDIDVNINGKIVTLNNEIMIRLETPEDFQVDPDVDINIHTDLGGDGGHTSNGSSPAARASAQATGRRPPPRDAPCAIALRVELNLADLVQDMFDVGGYIKNCIDIEDQLAEKIAAEKALDGSKQDEAKL